MSQGKFMKPKTDVRLHMAKESKLKKAMETENNVLDVEEIYEIEAKEMVREMIMNELSAAGWRVDYRPRNGREYNDAVYVSVDGKTQYWSIILAYIKLKKHYEAGDGEGKVYTPGFKFKPIPECVFNFLPKIMNKIRKSEEKLMHTGEMGGDRVNKRGRGRPRKGKRKCPPFLSYAYNRKRTVLSWINDMGTFKRNSKVYYMDHEKKSVLIEGKMTRDGIVCGCCDKIVTISEFEEHSGSKISNPFRNICVEGGISLLQCMRDSWNKQDESEREDFHFIDVWGSKDPNDDVCVICGENGDLICCDGCPSTFHPHCLGLNDVPPGDWRCGYCLCKFCGLAHGNENQWGTFYEFLEYILFTCGLCQGKYHISCREANFTTTVRSRHALLCGNGCRELFERLDMLLGVKHELEDGFSWSFICRSDDSSPHMIECNSKLAVALSIMDECFKPWVDHRTGINMLHSVVYNCGSNFNRLNYRGFFTAILERGDEIICAATIRIHGNQVAEMPYVATREMYRRQGMCRRLLNAIELALSSLDVEILVLAAISDVRDTWISAFGFEPLELTTKNLIKKMNLMVIAGVEKLQKKIPKQNVYNENLISTEVSNLQKKKSVHTEANNCDVAGVFGSGFVISDRNLPSNACQEVHNAQGEAFSAKAPKLNTNINSGDCQSKQLASEHAGPSVQVHQTEGIEALEFISRQLRRRYSKKLDLEKLAMRSRTKS